MDMGYAIIGKYKGKHWKSKIYDDAEEMSQKYHEYLNDKAYTNLKQYNAYIHYEEIIYEN